MVVRRCPQCGTTSDDQFGFCIKCGREFSKMDAQSLTCPLCGFKNPEEADFCVKCGTPLLFKNQIKGETKSYGPITVQKVYSPGDKLETPKRTSRWLILFGYIFSILGGILGLIIAIYLSTRKDPVAKKHGRIQLAIFVFYIALIAILFATGNIPADTFTNYKSLIMGNMTIP